MILEGKEAEKYIVEHCKHFKPDEFRCKCGCRGLKIDTDNVSRLEAIREAMNKPIYITSAYRCEKHNWAVGGTETSYHVKGMATDIKTREFLEDKMKLIKLAEQVGFTGIGISYTTFVHVDNGRERRW